MRSDMIGVFRGEWAGDDFVRFMIVFESQQCPDLSVTGTLPRAPKLRLSDVDVKCGASPAKGAIVLLQLAPKSFQRNSHPRPWAKQKSQICVAVPVGKHKLSKNTHEMMLQEQQNLRFLIFSTTLNLKHMEFCIILHHSVTSSCY